MFPIDPFGPPPMTPLFRSECGMGGSGGPINPNLGPSGWGNGGVGLQPGYDIGRPLNLYQEALRFSPPPVAPPPMEPIVFQRYEPEPYVDLYWRTDLVPDCGDDLCHLSDVPCFIETPKIEVATIVEPFVFRDLF